MLESGEAVDLLFTDMIMPGAMSGPELARAARSVKPGLKVMFTTGYTTESLEHHGEYVLHKPYDRRSLARAIRSILDGVAISGPKHRSVKLI
jgi:CheY-like chemotaxis protein